MAGDGGADGSVPGTLYPYNDLKGLAFTSGAITVSKETSPKRNFAGSGRGSQPPPNFDRSCKPQPPSSKSSTLSNHVELMNAKNSAYTAGAESIGAGNHDLLNETLNSTRIGGGLEMDSPRSVSSAGNSILNTAMHDQDDRGTMWGRGDLAKENGPRSMDRGAPSIDRSLKAKVLLRQTNREQNKDTINQILEAEHDLLEESLSLENQQLEKEKQWEMLKLERERQAEQEMNEQVMVKEEALIEEIERLEKEKKHKDEENYTLREELQSMKDKLGSESAWRQKLEYEKQKQIIKQKEQERDRVQAEAEKKRQERKAKQKRDLEEQEKRIQEAQSKRKEVEADLAARQIKIDMARRGIQQNDQSTNITREPLKDENESTAGEYNRHGFGRLKRSSLSHSSPNIAKMLDDEDSAAELGSNIPHIPLFNREQKPSSYFHEEDSSSNNNADASLQKTVYRSGVGARNFNGVWSIGTGKKGLTGLKNLGNTCYMNR